MEIKPIFKGENVLPIVFAFNDEYSKYFSVALQSLIENSSKNYNYDIVALISDVQEDNKKTLLKMMPNNFSLRFFNMKEYLPVKFKDARNQAMIVKSTRFIDLYFKIKNSSNIVFWGASLFLKEFLQMYNIDSTDILGIIDTNPKLWQEKMSNYTIYSPKDLKKLNPDVVIITIINADYRADIQEFIQNEQITTELLTVF